ncbi:MAG: TRAP transporter fused permease subunit [Actinophytocola sp.]|nr:TRAP transporter fused permease subunit [Actinophytocola sp.]
MAESKTPDDDDAAAATPHIAEVDAADPVHPHRDLGGIIGRITQVIAIAYTAYYLYTAQFGITSPQAHRGFYWGFAGVLIFLLYPWRSRSKNQIGQRVPVWDLALAILVAVLTAYFVFNYAEIVSRGGRLSDTEFVLGSLAVLVSLEMTRRVVGSILTVIGAVVIVYAFFGPYMPGVFAHRGHDLERLISTSYTSFNGIFGSVADIFATYVFIFIVFGAFMQKSGAGQFFVDLPFAIAGKARGGPAKVAVMVSAIMGSVNGSPVANVMTTGTLTIPLMRRVGYSREFSGGVEAAASVGGQMLPPVMGAGAFLIAEFTQTPYTTIVLVSIVPALLYFFSVYLLVDFQALKRNLRGLPASELPDWKVVLKQGWYFLIPLALLFTLVVMRFSPAFAGFWAVVAVAVIGVTVPYRGRRMGWRDILDAVRLGAVSSLTVGAVVGTIGIVIGIVDLTGLGLRFSDLIVDLSGGNLLAALILVTLVSWLLGAGLTVTSSYIMVAILAAPALTEMGVSLLVAHLIVFWVSQDANVTPPIALASFSAAGISGGKPMRTAWESWLLARGLYIVPFLMAYTALVDGPVADAIPVVITAVLGIYLLSAGMSGYLRRPTIWYERAVLLAGGVLLIAPGVVSNLIGLGLGVAIYFIQRLRPERSSDEVAPAGGNGA